MMDQPDTQSEVQDAARVMAHADLAESEGTDRGFRRLDLVQRLDSYLGAVRDP